MRLTDVVSEKHDCLVNVQPTRNCDAEEVLELTGPNQHGRTGGETYDDCVRNEIDQAAETCEAHRQLEHADHKGEGQGVANVIRRAPERPMRPESRTGRSMRQSLARTPAAWTNRKMQQ